MDKEVSFDNEQLILVDPEDKEVGYMSKDLCHEGDGTLHRAFSIFIFNSAGEILLQQRSELKKLWPEFWSNSCCSHPRKGESMHDATNRRLSQELNMTSDLKAVYKFEYKARYLDIGTEHELCSVFVGQSDDDIVVNRNEISDWCWMLPSKIDEMIQLGERNISPWFKMEWETLRNEFPLVLSPNRK